MPGPANISPLQAWEHMAGEQPGTPGGYMTEGINVLAEPLSRSAEAWFKPGGMQDRGTAAAGETLRGVAFPPEGGHGRHGYGGGMQDADLSGGGNALLQIFQALLGSKTGQRPEPSPLAPGPEQIPGPPQMDMRR